MIELVKEQLKVFTEERNIPGHHGYEHYITVYDHAVKASVNLSEENKIEVLIAALLHDVDDEKLFGKNDNYKNARKILSNTLDVDVEKVIEMIDLVSCSKSGNKVVNEIYKYIPRDCDRLEGIGEIGIKRCKEYIDDKKVASHLDSTPRVYNEEELNKIATIDRFISYTNGKRSVSMLDHFYDKLLHIGKPENLLSQNPYILAEASNRNNIMTQFVINYWKQQS